MSRIGRKPIPFGSDVNVSLNPGNEMTVKGPKGTLSCTLNSEMIIEITDNVITVQRPSDSKKHKSMHGLTRTLIANMVEGVTKGYEKVLEVNGVGYRAAKQGKKLVLNLGYSHPVEMEEIDGITIEVPNPNSIIVKGFDKQLVGEFAANVRKQRPPEPYKGKGIKYSYEVIKRKEGKTGGKKK